MKKKRLDDILLERGIAGSKENAGNMILAGEVLVHGQKAIAPSQTFSGDSAIEIRPPSKYVGRGGEKLAHALNSFGIAVGNKTALDIGSATGGFVDVLLQNGAKKVYAVDTARGKLDLKLRTDPRVKVLEETNILNLNALPERADLISIDVSLTSLRTVFPILHRFLKEGGEVVALFKPQYEIEDKSALRHGVVKDDAAREKTFTDFLHWLKENGWHVLAKTQSPIRGSEGNIEYLIHTRPKS